MRTQHPASALVLHHVQQRLRDPRARAVSSLPGQSAGRERALDLRRDRPSPARASQPASASSAIRCSHRCTTTPTRRAVSLAHENSIAAPVSARHVARRPRDGRRQRGQSPARRQATERLVERCVRALLVRRRARRARRARTPNRARARDGRAATSSERQFAAAHCAARSRSSAGADAHASPPHRQGVRPRATGAAAAATRPTSAGRPSRRRPRGSVPAAVPAARRWRARASHQLRRRRRAASAPSRGTIT